MTTTAPARRGGLERWAGLGGIAYAVLFLVGGVVSFNGQPDTDSPPAKVISYYGDSGHRDKIAIGWLLVLVGVFFFIWFVGALRLVLSRIDGDGLLTAVATIGGGIYAALTLAAFSLDTAIKTMSDDTFRHQVYPGLIHAADDAGYVMHAAGGVGAGAMIVAASLAFMRATLVPAWVGWVGVAIGIVAIVSILFIPMFLIALWLVVVGLLLYRAAPAAA